MLICSSRNLFLIINAENTCASYVYMSLLSLLSSLMHFCQIKVFVYYSSISGHKHLIIEVVSNIFILFCFLHLKGNNYTIKKLIVFKSEHDLLVKRIYIFKPIICHFSINYQDAFVCICFMTEMGNVDPGGPVSLQSLAPTLIKHTWSS